MCLLIIEVTPFIIFVLFRKNPGHGDFVFRGAGDANEGCRLFITRIAMGCNLQTKKERIKKLKIKST